MTPYDLFYWSLAIMATLFAVMLVSVIVVMVIHEVNWFLK